MTDTYPFCSLECSEGGFDTRLGFFTDQFGPHYIRHVHLGQADDTRCVGRFGGDRCEKARAGEQTGVNHDHCSASCQQWDSEPCENSGCPWPCFKNRNDEARDYPRYCSSECVRVVNDTMAVDSQVNGRYNPYAWSKGLRYLRGASRKVARATGLRTPT